MFLSVCIQPNPKSFSSIVYKKRKTMHFYHGLKKKYKTGYYNQFIIIH
jgi:hypothetical protein